MATAGPGEAVALGRLVDREAHRPALVVDVLVPRARQDAARAFDHDSADVGLRRSDEADRASPGLDPAAHPLDADAGLARAAAAKKEPGLPVARRRKRSGRATYSQSCSSPSARSSGNSASSAARAAGGRSLSAAAANGRGMLGIFHVNGTRVRLCKSVTCTARGLPTIRHRLLPAAATRPILVHSQTRVVPPPRQFTFLGGQLGLTHGYGRLSPEHLE